MKFNLKIISFFVLLFVILIISYLIYKCTITDKFTVPSVSPDSVDPKIVFDKSTYCTIVSYDTTQKKQGVDNFGASNFDNWKNSLQNYINNFSCKTIDGEKNYLCTYNKRTKDDPPGIYSIYLFW